MRIEDVHARELQRSQTNHETYKSIFEQCCQRIKRRVDLRLEPRIMTFQVPPIVWGRPPYAHNHAVRYVSEKLLKKGFKVSPAHHPGQLYVEWSRPPPLVTKKKRAKPADNARAPKARTKDTPLSARLAALRKQLAS